MKRLECLDALRGLAIVLMVVNHTGHYLTADPLPAWAYLAVYLTVTLAAPLFLFSAGFALALSIKKARERREPAARAGIFQRGLVLISLGWLINLFFYGTEPLWRGRILLAIGASLILAYPFYDWAASRAKRSALAIVSLSGLLAFPAAYPLLQSISADHRIIAEIFLSEFPLYPWFFLVLIGLLAGREFLAREELAGRERKIILAAGAAALLAWLVLSLALNGGNILSFANDYNLNGYWNPSPLTWLWILGWIAILFLLFYAGESNLLLRSKLRNIFGRPAGQAPSHATGQACLARLGRAALPLYFLQFFLIITVGRTLLKLETADFFWFVLINLLIIYLLCLSAKSSIFATSTVYGRLKPKARIS